MIYVLIIIVTSILSVYSFTNPDVFQKFVLNPHKMYNFRGQYYRLISHGFVHVDISHLFFNMLTLYFFGGVLEKSIMSSTEFLIFYFAGIIIPSLISYQKYKSNSNYIACGASGGISAVLFALVLFKPWATIYIHFIIPIYLIIFAIGYLVYSYYMDKNHKSNIAHDVHFYGALFGISYILIFHPNALHIFIKQILNPPF